MKREKKNNKKKFLEILRKKDFHISKTCEAFGISRVLFYKWLKEDTSFKEEYDEMLEAEKDEAESLHRIIRRGIPILDDETNEILGWIEKPDRQAIETFLKSKAKDRGWGEKLEIDGTMKIQWIEERTYGGDEANEEADTSN